MTARKKRLICICLAAALLAAAGYCYLKAPWGFAREVSRQEKAMRLLYVETAAGYLGDNESDGSHRAIIDLYNSHQPLAQDYTVTYEDSWCAAFVSAMAIQSGITDIVPTECSCERQIGLFRDLGRWQEKDTYVPLPGDLIFYDWDEWGLGDSTGWADHVGIVVGTKWPFIKVIEGNWKDSVTYHYILMGHPQVRGFALPDFASIC
ncbi:MAG: CHAP domain-containing protein [Eubacteriales bacterium]|nr:CHAP domain-containing protein [Eubacteriales bacterium]